MIMNKFDKFSDTLGGVFQAGKQQALSFKEAVVAALGIFGIKCFHFQVKVDAICIEKPVGSILRPSAQRGATTLPVIYVVMSNSDTGSGSGPMVPTAHFFDAMEACRYMHNLPGVQGRRDAWYMDKYGDHYIDIIPVFQNAETAEMCIGQAYEMERAKRNLKEAFDRFETRRDFLAQRHQDVTDMVEPKLEEYFEYKVRELPEDMSEERVIEIRYYRKDLAD